MKLPSACGSSPLRLPLQSRPAAFNSNASRPDVMALSNYPSCLLPRQTVVFLEQHRMWVSPDWVGRLSQRVLGVSRTTREFVTEDSSGFSDRQEDSLTRAVLPT